MDTHGKHSLDWGLWEKNFIIVPLKLPSYFMYFENYICVH